MRPDHGRWAWPLVWQVDDRATQLGKGTATAPFRLGPTGGPLSSLRLGRHPTEVTVIRFRTADVEGPSVRGVPLDDRADGAGGAA